MNIRKVRTAFVFAFLFGIVGSLAVGLIVAATSDGQIPIINGSGSIDAKKGDIWSVCTRLPEATPDSDAPELAQHIHVQATDGLTVSKGESDIGAVLWDRHGSQMRKFYEIHAMKDGRFDIQIDEEARSHEFVAIPFSWMKTAWAGGLFCVFCGVGVLGVFGYLAARVFESGMKAGGNS